MLSDLPPAQAGGNRFCATSMTSDPAPTPPFLFSPMWWMMSAVVDLGSDDLARRIEGHEAGVWAKCMDAVDRASQASASPLTAHTVQVGFATAFALEGLDSFDVNRVLGLGLAEPLAPARSTPSSPPTATSAFIATNWRWSKNPRPDARACSAAAGLVQHRDPIWTVWRDVDGSAKPERDVPVRVLEPSDGGELAKLQRTAWGIWEPAESHDLWFRAPLGTEGFTHFGAYLDGELVAAGALYVDATADPTLAWAGFDATHPRLRRQRLRHELGVARQWHAAELGCEVIHGDMYYKPKQRTWRLAYRKTRWVPPDPEGMPSVA